MKCTSKWAKAILFLLVFVSVSGCGSKELVKEYKVSDNGSMWKAQGTSEVMEGMAQQLCVVNADLIPDGMEAMAGSTGLFDISNNNVMYASKVHEKMYPASITKIMTALVFLENYQGDFSEMVTASNNVVFKESGVQVCGYKPGDSVSLEHLLHGLLVYSGNDAAVMLAEYTAGSVEDFVNLMNKRAVQLGATNTHFVNPHGLSDDEHYTTAYDLYLIFQQVIKYDKFRQVINTNSYEGEYQLSSGQTKKLTFSSTNQFLSGEKGIPEGVTVIGGKTGTTNAAGNCLILLSQGANGSEYISVVLKAETKDALYEDMTKLLDKISNSN